MTETRLGDHRRSRVPTTRALFPSLLDFPSIWVTGLSLLASTLIRRRPTFRPGPPPFPFRASLSFRRSASERFRRFAAAPIYVPAFGVINAVVRLYPRSLERLRRERLTARNPVTPRRPSRPTRTYSYLVARLYRFAESQRATILLTFSSRRLRGVPVCESASRCSLASWSSRARSRRAKIHSRFPSVRTFLERETMAPTADVSRRLSPAIPRISRGLVEATYARLLATTSGRFLAVESYIPLVNYVVDGVVSSAVIARDAAE